MKRGIPITIRGVAYPSHRAAARANGVSFQNIRKAADAGRADNIGLGQRPRPVTDGVIVFDSARAAADALGIPLRTIYGRIRRGTWRYFSSEDRMPR